MFKISSPNWYLNKFFLLFIYLFISLKVFWPVAFLTKKLFVHTLGNGSRGRILALAPHRFRGDLSALEGAHFTIVALDFYWMQRISTCFFRLPIRKEIIFERNSSEDVDNSILRLNRKLIPFVDYLSHYLAIDVVISGAVHYAADYLWGQALSKVNVPFVVLHRESNKSSVFQRNYWRDYWSKVPKYDGDYVIVHNEPCRAMFVESGIVNQTHCLALGALRMDDYLQVLGNLRVQENKQKSLLFFSFFPGVGLPNHSIWAKDTGFRQLFLSAHEIFFQFLKDNPQVKGVLKLKWQGGARDWEAALDLCLENIGCSADELSNLKITADDVVQDLIIESTAVIAFGSTTMLEALVAGKPVIVPFFAEAAEKKMQNKILFLDDFRFFNVATDTEHFVELMHAGVNEGLGCDVEGGKYLFQKWLGATDGKIVERHGDFFDKLIKEKPQMNTVS